MIMRTQQGNNKDEIFIWWLIIFHYVIELFSVRMCEWFE